MNPVKQLATKIHELELKDIRYQLKRDLVYSENQDVKAEFDQVKEALQVQINF